MVPTFAEAFESWSNANYNSIKGAIYSQGKDILTIIVILPSIRMML